MIVRTVADLVERPRREIIVPRCHRVIAWLDRLLPGLFDLGLRWRRRW